MIYKNLNPNLTSDLIEKAGFKFDGYYYINPLCPIKINSSTDGYTINFIDEAAPLLNQLIITYSDLISMMVQFSHYTIDKSIKISNLQFNNAKDQLNFIGESLKSYFSFDENIKFSVMSSPMGIKLNPNNEYTFTIISGDIKLFKVYYEWYSNESVSRDSIELELAAQCISWPFLMKLLMGELLGFNKKSDKLVITQVMLLDEDQEIPFFGMGIPTIHKN